MSDERVLADSTGTFAQVVRDGRERHDATWTSGRVVLSNKRLALVGSEGKRTIPLASVRDLGGRFDVNQAVASVGDYVSFRYDDQVVLVAPGDAGFETSLYGALLDQRAVLVRHPAVAGGVVHDTAYEKGRVSVDDDALGVATTSGEFTEIGLDDIGSVEDAEREVRGSERRVLDVEHADDGTSVHTHLTGSNRDVMALASFLRQGERQNDTAVDLGRAEKDVLMALYSGVSPFDIPGFLDASVDDVEDIYERLVRLDILDEVRVRREVTLNARGRNLANDAMNEQ